MRGARRTWSVRRSATRARQRRRWAFFSSLLFHGTLVSSGEAKRSSGLGVEEVRRLLGKSDLDGHPLAERHLGVGAATHLGTTKLGIDDEVRTNHLLCLRPATLVLRCGPARA